MLSHILTDDQEKLLAKERKFLRDLRVALADLDADACADNNEDGEKCNHLSPSRGGHGGRKSAPGRISGQLILIPCRRCFAHLVPVPIS